ncbi:MAG TPA: hotdog fold thioesterase [Gemmatimonadaceae bacterium]|nr:hotdog fold thioesterase [Gemmatimonadaceae bacterium]
MSERRGGPPPNHTIAPPAPSADTDSPPTVPDERATSADAAQALAERCVARMLAHDAFSRWLGLEVLSVRPDAVTVRMTVRQEMLNGFGVCHGGVTFALADSALAFAANTHGRVTLSVENGISYPAPVRAGDVLTAEARQESGGQRVVFFRVLVRRHDGDTVAIFRGTVYRTGRPLLDEGAADDSVSDPAPQ